MNQSSKRLEKNRLKKAVQSAIWSVTVEGLKPTKTASKNLQNYAEGRITVAEMRQNALKNARALAKARTLR